MSLLEKIKNIYRTIKYELDLVPGKTLMTLSICILIMMILCLNNIIIKDDEDNEQHINKVIMIFCVILLITIPILLFFKFYNNDYIIYILGNNLNSYIISVILGVFGIAILVNVSKHTN